MARLLDNLRTDRSVRERAYQYRMRDEDLDLMSSVFLLKELDEVSTTSEIHDLAAFLGEGVGVMRLQ